MTHSEAILLIRDGGLYVRLLLRSRNAPPPSLDGKNSNTFSWSKRYLYLEVQSAMGNRIESPHTHWKPSGYA